MRVLTLGALATRRRYYGVGQLEQRPVGTFLVLAGVATALMLTWIVVDRYSEWRDG